MHAGVGRRRPPTFRAHSHLGAAAPVRNSCSHFHNLDGVPNMASSNFPPSPSKNGGTVGAQRRDGRTSTHKLANPTCPYAIFSRLTSSTFLPIHRHCRSAKRAVQTAGVMGVSGGQLPCPSLHASVHLCIICLSIYPSIHHLSTYPSTYLCTYPCVWLFIYHLSLPEYVIYLSIFCLFL